MEAVADTAAAVTELVTIPKFPFLFWAYTVIFAIILIYLIGIHVRQRRLNTEIVALTRRLDEQRRLQDQR